MASYRRRRTSLVRTFWVYRRVVALAIVLGLILWFIVINQQAVTVYFPFRLGQLNSSAGVLILLSVLAGTVVGALLTGLVMALRHHRRASKHDHEDTSKPYPIDERPPADYAAKTTEGFEDVPWAEKQ
jgi:uncharacterized integral membrane protein